MEFWDEKKECMQRDEIEQIQLERLQATLNRVDKNVSHYKKLFREIDFLPADLRSLKEFNKLPFTTRQDLKDNYPYGMFAVPLREVVRLHAPALTLDKPIVMGFTANDLKTWADLIARNLTAVGVQKDDGVQVSLALGKTAAPFGIQLGTELIGASVIPLSGRKLPNQVKIMRDFRSTVLVATPTFAMGLVQTMETLGVEVVDLSLKSCILGCEPWSEATRTELESRLSVTATDTYGLTDIFSLGVAWECPAKNGLHISEDCFIPEIVDPVTLKPLPEGEVGELVLTTISKQAFPLIRFRTGDLARIDYGVCTCGRTHARISRIFQRCDGIIVMRGTSISPEDIAKILTRVNGTTPRYQLVVDRQENQDQLIVMIEISDKIFFDEMSKQSRLMDDFHHTLSEYLGWEVKVKLVEPGSLDPDVRVKDNRRFQ